ncbi:helix-turn-helix domain-containing protein [Sutcliffiella horikoshii]|uniref:helix-turn-helix domain-containing protein n=1 Tax=Sutcliffiella horikoshii TaxID=79883 RepID=UPI0007D0A130|nr:RodZ domain-containing protein [Sutcliffiella horikoshii]MCM3616195.1 helix-turn-helix domain-containing protein [Sutcliffiella horikoshii]
MTELGNRLRQAREEKGMSLEDLQTATKIQKRYLIGIEEGNYSIMPGQFYARAFIKQYAEAVGLDPEVIFEEFKQDIPANEKEEIPQLSRVKTRKQVPAKNNKVLNFIPKILMFLALVAVVAILYILFQNWDFGNNSDPQEDSNRGVVYDPADTEDEDQGDGEQDEATGEEPVEEPEEEQGNSAGTLTEVSSSQPNATLELTGADAFEVELSAIGGNTWVGISNSEGEYFHSKELAEGETETFDLTEETEILFNIGWVPATEIKINGEVLEYPFPADDVTTQKITIKFAANGQQ